MACDQTVTRVLANMKLEDKLVTVVTVSDKRAWEKAKRECLCRPLEDLSSTHKDISKAKLMRINKTSKSSLPNLL